jgi:hypothetical protein
VLAQKLLAAGAKEGSEYERDEDRVVELAGDGDEVGYEIEGHREVGDQRDYERLTRSGDPVVGKQAAEQHDAVRNETGERTRVGATTHNEQGEDERALDQKCRSHPDRGPVPGRHAFRVCVLRPHDEKRARQDSNM